MPRKGTRIVGTILVSLLLVSAAVASSTYLRRWTMLRLPDVGDYSRLPARTIARSSRPVVFPAATEGDWIAPLGVRYQNQAIESEEALGQFLAAHATTAFIVIRDGRILEERYFNGYRRDSLFKSFSVSKSVLSALFGVAISDGLIGSLDEPVTKYVPEMRDTRFKGVTLRHCLDNTAGIAYSRGAMPWKDQPHMYYTANARGFIQKARIGIEPGTQFVQEDLSPILLGYVLERAVQKRSPGRTVSDYFRERIWYPLGAEYDALWNLDREKNGLEKSESGFTARAIDLAKLASLYLNDGRWGTQQLVPTDWVVQSTTVPGGPAPNVWKNGFHTHLWWGYKTSFSRPDFYANGHFGQRLYVSPRNRLVLVRMGTDNAGIDWTDFLGTIADAIARREAAQQPASGAGGEAGSAPRAASTL